MTRRAFSVKQSTLKGFLCVGDRCKVSNTATQHCMDAVMHFIGFCLDICCPKSRVECFSLHENGDLQCHGLTGVPDKWEGLQCELQRIQRDLLPFQGSVTHSGSNRDQIILTGPRLQLHHILYFLKTVSKPVLSSMSGEVSFMSLLKSHNLQKLTSRLTHWNGRGWLCKESSPLTSHGKNAMS